MKKAVLIATAVIGMMTSCVEERNRFVVAHRIKGDTTTLQMIKVNRNFQVGEVVIPVGLDSTKFKIVRIARTN
jgi:hypothetical protein